MKKCIKCQQEKPLSEFHKWNQRKDMLRPDCKSCRKIDSKKHYIKFKNDIVENSRRYRDKNPNFNSNYYSNNLEYFKNYYIKNIDRYKQWRIDNKKRLLEHKKQRIKNEPELKILCNLRSYVSTKIRKFNGVKCDRTINLLGCSISDFRNHLQSKFVNGMNWENYGRKGWHIDHINPCESFDLTQESAQRKCFHYTNLQPLWAIDNLRKGCRVNPN